MKLSSVNQVSWMQINMMLERKTLKNIKMKLKWTSFLSHMKNIKVTTVNRSIIIASSKAVEADLSFSFNFFGMSFCHRTSNKYQGTGYFLPFARVLLLKNPNHLFYTYDIVLESRNSERFQTGESAYFDVKTCTNICPIEQVLELSKHILPFFWTWSR